MLKMVCEEYEKPEEEVVAALESVNGEVKLFLIFFKPQTTLI